MKITRIEIKDFQQFKDFTLDLTYPTGHPKAGKPLDKVCFIGQSGTGKTTILNVMKDILDKVLFDGGNIHSVSTSFTQKVLFKVYFEYMGKTYELQKTDEEREFKAYNAYIYPIDSLKRDEMKDIPHYIYIPANLELWSISLYSEDLRREIASFISNSSLKKERGLKMKNDMEKKRAYDFTKTPVLDIWKLILYDSKVYINEISKFSRLAGAAYVEGNLYKAEIYKKEFEKVAQDTKNPFKLLKDVLNEVVNIFNLEVSLNLDVNNFLDLNFIKIQSLQGNEIKFEALSTGTKQIILTAMPISRFKDVVVLFDEPERSLFPDVQRGLIDYYTKLAPESQFFFATHSPLIASQFEPCERFILSFDENGKVQASNGVAPQGDDPNDLLFKDFGMRSIMPKVGEEVYKRFIELLTLIHNANTTTEKHALTNEYLKLQKDYNF